MNSKWYGAVVVGGLVLLTGCGGGGGTESAEPLTAKQVEAVLPDDAAMSGWKVSTRAAEPLPRISRAGVCGVAEEKKTPCDGLRFYSQGQYTAPDQQFSVIVSVFAAKDTDGAEPAYDELWQRVLKSGAKPEKIDSGVLGDEHDAFKSAYGRAGGPVAQIQVRVGANVLQITGEAAPDKELDVDAVVDVAAVVTERAEQAGRGDSPSAALGD
ncbi:hypothetical protein [Streptomyces mesophilus]|uniref:hypothetical protein n=1 Tax=Streptomyces mesophilus TaxID=1775132 RepID=UPI00331D4AA7